MLMLMAIGALGLLWLILDLSGLQRRGGLLEFESQHALDMATVWLRLASGYKLVLADETRGLFVWERGRRFNDGGFFYYAQVWQDLRSRRARFAIGVMGHKFHTAEELASARARFVGTQVFQMTARSAEDAVVRAADPRTARAVHPAVRRLAGRQTDRPPVIDAPMSPFCLRFSLRSPLSAVREVATDLSADGWRLVETTSLKRGLVTQYRYCFEDAAQRKDAGAEYLLEVCAYSLDWVMLAIDWFPAAQPTRPARRPAELEADIRRKVERARVVVREAADEDQLLRSPK